MTSILVTGGNGFIGSNFIRFLLKNHTTLGLEDVINLDSRTYSGRGNNLEHMGLSDHPFYSPIPGDIRDHEAVDFVFASYRPDFVFNFAAESHVDRSIESSEQFRTTNFGGVGVLLDASLRYPIQQFIQIGTDEVYGSLNKNSPLSKEIDLLKPRSPYAATKAAADLLALSYFHTHGLPVIITRSSNNYGEYQFPEKIIPKFITRLIEGKKVPLMWSEENQGENVRDWLYVQDNCEAIWFASQKGKPGEIYNVAGGDERTNIEITRMVLKEFEAGEERIERVPHRKGHDFRYSVDMSKLRKLGFSNRFSKIDERMTQVCEWYKNNRIWWEPLKQ